MTIAIIEQIFDFIVHNLFIILWLFVHNYCDTIILSTKQCFTKMFHKNVSQVWCFNTLFTDNKKS